MIKSILKTAICAIVPEFLIVVLKQIRDKRAIELIKYEEIHNEEIGYIKRRGIVVNIPYAWAEEYNYPNIYWDNQYPYIIVKKNRRLYLRPGFGMGMVGKQDMRAYMIEQDARSPHRYFSEKIIIDDDTVFLDCGAAEGFITLQNIEKVKKAYLFECEPDWIEVLEKTFSPFNEKVEIIPKYVGDKDSETETSLVNIINNHEGEKIIIKMDIEGAEVKAVRCLLENILYQEKLQFTVCIYHNHSDYEEMKNLFEKHGFITEVSNGWILYGEPLEFRKGIIRAWKD